VKCKICSREFKNSLGLSAHLKSHNITPKDYYDKFFGKKTCLNCGKETTFISLGQGYRKFCSLSCSSTWEHNHFSEKEKKERINKIKKNNKKNEMEKMEILDKRKKTNIEKYGEEFPTKITENNKKTFGVENPFAYGGEKFKEMMVERYGVDNAFKMDFVKKKIKKNKDEIKLKKESTSMDNFGEKYYLQTKEGKTNFSSKKDTMIEKYKKTCNEKYGVDFYIQAEPLELKKKRVDAIWKSKKENGTTNSSSIEDDLYDFLSKFYTAKRNYKSDEYPFHCDYYIEELNLYIELQGFWAHGYKSFDKKLDEEKVSVWKEKAKTSTFYENALNIWTNTDIKKRECAERNKINFLEIFDYSDFAKILKQIDRVINGLTINYNYEEMKREYKSILKRQGDYKSSARFNKIIKTFQPHFFNEENKIYTGSPTKRRKLIENRIKYLNKKESELTNIELLNGFKISGIYNSFSHFSPLWIKKFIYDYKIKNLYDPCGGWGHRLLGCNKLINYIYNDFDKRTVDGVNKIINMLDIKNSKVYNNDCRSFLPEENFEAVFFSPPYFNDETYNNKSFKDMDDYDKWIRDFLDNILNKDFKYFALVISNKYRRLYDNILTDYFNLIEERKINKNKSHFNKKGKIFETISIWRRK
jgi:hypothetical protein